MTERPIKVLIAKPGLDGHDRNGPARSSQLADQRGDEGALAGARRPGDANEVGLPGQRVQPAQGRLGNRRSILDGGQQPRQ